VANKGDMKAHDQTYGSVMSMLKWGTVATAIVAVIVVLLIAN
jgi:Bacterial aa3 type cytochrome c oxidase subunit IV